MKISKIWFVCLVCCFCEPPPNSDLFSGGEELGNLDKELNEVSGLVASRRNEGLLWAHNDSRNDADVFLIDLKGNIQCTYTLKGIDNRDWEDISMGPGADSDESYLYVADIGDNEARYPVKYLYRFLEPTADENHKKVELTQFDTLVVRLPVGAQDTEAFAVDPKTGDLYLFSKRLPHNSVYRLLASDVRPGDTLAFQQVFEIPYYNIVAADFSVDGTELLVKTYNEMLYWKKTSEESWAQACEREPILLTYKPEPQGEAVAWAADGSGYFTASEFRDHKAEPLIFYKRN